MFLFSINLVVRSCLELYSYIGHWPCLQSVSNNYPLLTIASKLKMQYMQEMEHMANVHGLPTYTITLNNLMDSNHPNHIFILNPKPTNTKLVCSTIRPYNLYALTSSLWKTFINFISVCLLIKKIPTVQHSRKKSFKKLKLKLNHQTILLSL